MTKRITEFIKGIKNMVMINSIIPGIITEARPNRSDNLPEIALMKMSVRPYETKKYCEFKPFFIKKSGKKDSVEP